MIDRMTPLQCLKAYIAVRQHFTNKRYNLFEKGVRIKLTEDHLSERNDKAFFYRLSDEYLKGDLMHYFMANIMDGKHHPSEMQDVVFKEWRSKMHSIEYRFEQDLKFLVGLGKGFRPLFFTSNGKLPIVLQAANGNRIMIETIIIIDMITEGAIMKTFDTQITDRFTWEDIQHRINKYRGFLRTSHINIEALKNILSKYMEEQ